jgi:hypothetical protein
MVTPTYFAARDGSPLSMVCRVRLQEFAPRAYPPSPIGREAATEWRQR